MSRYFTNFVSFMLLANSVLIEADEINRDVINYYLESIEKHMQASQNIEYPSDARVHDPENKTLEEYGEFDFIVVGAGSTGCIIANRLSEVQTWSVLLLEAGTYPGGDLLRIPALNYLDEQSKFNWGYKSIPQRHVCLNNGEARCPISRGKGIGGTSLINGLMYVRGSKTDYNKWSELLNDSSYRYENLLPYFRKTENLTQQNPNLRIDWEYHGKNGPLHVLQSDITTELERAILQGSKLLGYPVVDHNGEQILGASVTQYYIKDGKRDDPGLAFISTARNKHNLKVLDQSYVIKLDINNDTKRINGVIFTRDNKTYIARNRKEVILSAGSVGSPQILLQSGIGPEEHLLSLGIPVIQNSLVGQTLRDHTYTVLMFSSNTSTVTEISEESVREFLKGGGPLTSANSCNAFSLFKISTGPIESGPDIEIIVTSNAAALPNITGPFVCAFQILHTNSIGSLKLKNTNPFEYPLIDTNNLSDDRDVEALYEAFKVVSELMNTEPLRKLNVTLALTPPAHCNSTTPNSKDFWICTLKSTTYPGNHLTSTCLTGTNPETGVVDKNLKVFGVKHLRVADASIIPFPLANHPTATCSVIAEKISEEIKTEYSKLN